MKEKRITLGSLCASKIDTLPSYFDGNIDYIDISSVDNIKKTITSMQHLSASEVPSRAKQLLLPGDILVSTVRPNLNAVAMVHESSENTLVGSTGYCVLRCKESVNSRFIYYFCQSPYFVDDMTAQATGASYPAVSSGIVKNALIPHYSYEEQCDIADLFDCVNGLITKRREQLAKLDELVKSRFIELFNYDMCPKLPFGAICEFVRNGASIKQEKGAGGIPITRIETLSNEVFNTDRLGYAGITDISKYEKYILRKGDLLISHINSVAYLGRTVQYRGEAHTPIIHGMNLLCARLLDGYHPTYIEFFMKSKEAKDYIATITKKAVNQASITTSDLKQMNVPIPPMELQNGFAAFVEQTDKQKLTVQQSLDTLELLKKALMQKYFG